MSVEEYERPARVRAVLYDGTNRREVEDLVRGYTVLINSFGDPVIYLPDGGYLVVEMGCWAAMSEAGPEVWPWKGFLHAHTKVAQPPPPGPDGCMNFDQASNEWVMSCDACGELGRGDGNSAQAHNDLVLAWSIHDRDVHGGDGLAHHDALLIKTSDGAAS